jgi:hypothetical protein
MPSGGRPRAAIARRCLSAQPPRQRPRSIRRVSAPLCPTCGQPAGETLGGPPHAWDCRNEACPEFGQPVEDADRARRLAFAIPPIDPPLEHLDPADEDDRSVLLAAAHPELGRDAETVIVGGQEMNPRLHLVMHAIVAKQLADLDPPEVWDAARRLRRLGYPRHEILHMLGTAMGDQLWHAMHEQRDYDPDAHAAALAALPGSWERQRPGGPSPPASLAAHADEAKRRRKAQRAARRAHRRR